MREERGINSTLLFLYRTSYSWPCWHFHEYDVLYKNNRVENQFNTWQHMTTTWSSQFKVSSAILSLAPGHGRSPLLLPPAPTPRSYDTVTGPWPLPPAPTPRSCDTVTAGCIFFRCEYFSGVNIFQRFMFTAQFLSSEFRTVERCLVLVQF